MAIDTTGLSTQQASMIRAQEQLNNQSMANSMAMMKLQQQQQDQQQAITALSTIMKNGHDANMAVIRNAKAG